MFFSLDAILGYLLTYKYFLLFPISIVEGPIVTIIAGFLGSQGVLSLPLALWTVVLGDMVGDLIYYALGRYAGNAFLLKWGGRIGIHEAELLSLEDHFKTQGPKTLLIGKFTQAAGVVVLVAAGAARAPLGEFVAYNVAGTIPKSFVLLIVGYYFGEAYRQINDYFGYVSAIGSFVVVVAIVGFFAYRMHKKRKSSL